MKRFKDWKPPELEDGVMNKWNWLAFHPENIVFGYRCDIGAFTLLQGKYGIEIGKNVQVGPHSYISSWDTERNIKGKIIIKDNVLIGASVIILPKRNEDHIISKHIKARSVIY